jgi:iron complex outermembrane receptor protein
MVQAYYDRTHRFIPDVFQEDRNTFDVELQHQLRWGEHYIVYGGNYRFSHDEIGNLGPTLAFLPDNRSVHLVSGYLQDEWHIVPDKFFLTAGSKFEYNSFSGFEVQPTGRFTWLPAPNQTVWGAISRAVRSPTRIDQNLVAPNPAFATPFLLANPDFESETLLAYELGYRIKPAANLSFDLVGYYNDYNNLRSVEPLPGGKLTIENKLEGQSYGAALAAKWQILNWWRLDGSVSLLQVDIDRAPGGHDVNNGAAEANDPGATFVIHSGMDLPWNLQFDSYLRYVDDLPNPHTPSYLTADVRLAWSPRKNLEVAIVGRNLFDEAHPEFRTTTTSQEVERSVFATFKWTY